MYAMSQNNTIPIANDVVNELGGSNYISHTKFPLQRKLISTIFKYLSYPGVNPRGSKGSIDPLLSHIREAKRMMY